MKKHIIYSNQIQDMQINESRECSGGIFPMIIAGTVATSATIATGITVFLIEKFANIQNESTPKNGFNAWAG